MAVANAVDPKARLMAADTVRLLNVEIDNLTRAELFARLAKGGIVYTPNVDHLSKLQSDAEFARAYRAATFRVCDSKILIYAARFLGTPLQEKLSGSDLLPAFCQYLSKDGSARVFLLGGAPGVPEAARDRLNALVGRELIVGAYSPPYGFDRDPAECEKAIALVNDSGATVLAVGLGAPKQEKWIHTHKPELPEVRTFLAVGAALDFEAGNRARAPRWMSEVGLEWLYRVYLEPRRLWRRYFVEGVPILGLFLAQKLGRYQPPAGVGLVGGDPRRGERLGPLLQAAGLLDAEQLEKARALDALAPHLSFGEILVREGWLPAVTVDFFAEGLEATMAAPFPERMQAAGLLDGERAARLRADASAAADMARLAVERGWLTAQTAEFFLTRTLA